jgi:protein-tyrosine phosphatase
MVEIIKNLYLCSWSDAQDLAPTLDNLLIVNCTRDLRELTRNTYRVAIDDHHKHEDTLKLNENIIEVTEKIHNHLASGPVIVHCLAGRQRSAAVVASYLMLYHFLDVTQSINFIKSKKREAFFPEINFIETLNYVNSQNKD